MKRTAQEKVNCCLNPHRTAPNPGLTHNSERLEQVWDLGPPDQLVVAPRQQVLLSSAGFRRRWQGI